MASIGALVICHDEAANIEECLRHLGFCDERVVVDSFSDDDTVSRALPLADRVFRREFVDHAEQKNWGMEQLDTDWVLLVDADERVSDALAGELRHLAEDDASCDAYWIHRDNAFFGKWIRGAGWQRDRVLRFLRQGAGSYPHARLHEEIEVAAGRSIGVCRHRLWHYSYDSWPPTFQRLLQYSGAGAAERLRRGRSFSTARVVFAPAARFLRQYLIQAGFRDGFHGYALCVWSAIGVFLRELKGQLGEVGYPGDPWGAPTRAPRVEVVQGARLEPAPEEDA